MPKREVIYGKNWAGYDVAIGVKLSKEIKNEFYNSGALLFSEIKNSLLEITNYVKHAPLNEIYDVFINEYREHIESKIKYEGNYAILEFYDIDEILHEFSGVYDKRDKAFLEKGNLSHDGMVIKLLGFDSIFELYNHFGSKGKAIEFINVNIESVVVINGNLENYRESIKGSIKHIDNKVV